MADRAIAVALLVLAVLAACSGPPADLPAPLPSPPIEARYGAPVVTQPRELRGRASPCQLLTSDQLEQLSYESTGVPRSVAGLAPACVWRGPGSRRVSVAMLLDRDFLVDVYRNKVLPVFRPIEISGLPAVERQSGPESPFCTTAVGVSADEALDISVTGDVTAPGTPDADACAQGRRVVEAIVATLPPKQR